MISLPSPISAFKHSLIRELTVGFRNRADLANPIIFFACVFIFVPLGVSPEGRVLAPLAPGMIWIVALLATLLSLDRLFLADFEDGSLEQMLVSGQPLYWMVLAKALVHWLLTGLPLTFMGPILGLMMALPDAGYVPLMLSLFIGTACLSLIGAIGAALTVALRRGGLLLSLIIMPLYVPILIFGTGAIRNAITGFEFQYQLVMLVAFFFVALALAPLAAAGALRVGADG